MQGENRIRFRQVSINTKARYVVEQQIAGEFKPIPVVDENGVLLKKVLTVSAWLPNVNLLPHKEVE